MSATQAAQEATPANRWQRLSAAPVVWFSLAFGAFLFLQLPAGVAVLNDDFGYLGSVIETIRRGQPWTDDWLEPWAASLSIGSALVYGATGSFSCAVLGVQTLCAVAAAAGTYLLFRAREFPVRLSLALATLTLTFPTLAWKSVEYTSMALYLPCLVLALWSIESRRWSLFLLAWAVALGSRQSAITWVAFPLCAAFAGWRRLPQDRPAFLRPAAVATAGGLLFLVLMLGMNRTWAQAAITEQAWSRVELAAGLHHLGYGIGIWFVFTGVAAFLRGWSARPLCAATPVGWGTLAIAGAAALLLALSAGLPRLYFEHRSFDDGSGQLYASLLMAVALAGWWTFRFTIRPAYAVAAFAALAPVVLRRDVWDYYYLDIGFFALLGVAPLPKAAAVDGTQRWPLRAGWLLVALLGAWHASFCYQQKCRVDREYAVGVLTEGALRVHRLGPAEIGHAPFGFVGWQLHRTYSTQVSHRDPDIGGFTRYEQPNATEVRLSPMRFWSDSRSLRPLDGAEAARVVASDVFHVCWLWHQRISVLRATTPSGRPELELPPSRQVLRSLPLNDQEWRAHIEGRGR